MTLKAKICIADFQMTERIQRPKFNRYPYADIFLNGTKLKNISSLFSTPKPEAKLQLP